MNTTTKLSEFQGDLYRGSEVIRKRFKWHFTRIQNLSQCKATIRAGGFAWPGGYPLFLITHDCQPLCFDCARSEFRQIAWDYLNKASTGWRIIGCEVNYEDENCFCAHCSLQIPSAYGNA